MSINSDVGGCVVLARYNLSDEDQSLQPCCPLVVFRGDTLIRFALSQPTRI
jgi:hypothetical protein